MFINNKRQAKGFTLIEVLISIVILGGGVLGILNLQARALMDNQDAYLRTQAVLLAYDMSDRIRSNAEFWRDAIEDNTITDITDAAADDTIGDHFFCSAYDPTTAALADLLVVANDCAENQMAIYDVYRWQSDVAAVLNGGTVAIARAADVNTTSVATDILTLTISWQRVNQEMQSKLNNATYSLDVRP